ncbi:hypothetical protein Bbelb_318440 [Branchiostoma belcheri]|nr:hypothetical protein Bbelb_318440 [Branchiostoma belcheri]
MDPDEYEDIKNLLLSNKEKYPGNVCIKNQKRSFRRKTGKFCMEEARNCMEQKKASVPGRESDAEEGRTGLCGEEDEPVINFRYGLDGRPQAKNTVIGAVMACITPVRDIEEAKKRPRSVRDEYCLFVYSVKSERLAEFAKRERARYCIHSRCIQEIIEAFNLHTDAEETSSDDESTSDGEGETTLSRSPQVQIFQPCTSPPMLCSVLTTLGKVDVSLGEFPKETFSDQRSEEANLVSSIQVTERLQSSKVGTFHSDPFSRVIHGKPLTRTTSLVEGFVSLMGALYLFQLTYSSCIASAMVFIEYHILRDANIHRKDLSTSFLKAYKKFDSDDVSARNISKVVLHGETFTQITREEANLVATIQATERLQNASVASLQRDSTSRDCKKVVRLGTYGDQPSTRVSFPQPRAGPELCNESPSEFSAQISTQIMSPKKKRSRKCAGCGEPVALRPPGTNGRFCEVPPAGGTDRGDTPTTPTLEELEAKKKCGIIRATAGSGTQQRVADEGITAIITQSSKDSGDDFTDKIVRNVWGRQHPVFPQLNIKVLNFRDLVDNGAVVATIIVGPVSTRSHQSVQEKIFARGDFNRGRAREIHHTISMAQYTHMQHNHYTAITHPTHPAFTAGHFD